MLDTNRVSNLAFLAYLDSYEKSFPKRLSAIKSAIEHSLRGPLKNEIRAIDEKFFKKGLGLVGYRLLKQSVLSRKSNECPLCSKPMNDVKSTSCSTACNWSIPDVAARRSLKPGSARIDKKVADNKDLLEFLKSYKLERPSVYRRVRKSLIEASGSWSLPKASIEISPEFFEKSRSSFGLSDCLIKRTIVTHLSNKCPSCENLVSRPGYHCSIACSLNNPAIRSKIKKATKEIYGVDHVSKSPLIQAKRTKTMTTRYGATSYLGSVEGKAAVKKTNIERYGAEYPTQNKEVQARTVETNLKKYGFARVFQSPAVMKRARRTMRERYGVNYSLQNTEIRVRQQKALFNLKSFIDAMGKVHNTLQGYEPQVFDWLTGVGVEKIVSSRTSMPNIKYGRGRRYVPDARFIRKDKKYLLEVKSVYTLEKHSEQNNAKFKAAKDWCKIHDYTFVVAISNGRFGNKPELVFNPTALRLTRAIARIKAC